MTENKRGVCLIVAGLVLVLGVPAAAQEKKDRGFVDRVFKDADGNEHKYVLFVPHGYTEDKAYPLILFLHGAGEAEGGTKTPVEVGIGPAIKKYGEKEFPCLVLFPRCSKVDFQKLRGSLKEERFQMLLGDTPGTWGADGPDARRALAMLEDVQKSHRVDGKRLYLSGLSLGGFGTWSLAAKHPDKWAAIVPICGGGDPAQADKIKHIPCWCAHGDADQAVPIKLSRAMIEALKAAGGKPRYDEYPGVNHNSWDQAYGNRELYDWLLKQALK